MYWRLSVIVLLFTPMLVSAAPDFNREVAPILVKRCLTCHNPSETRGDLDLTIPEGASDGGKHLFERIEAGEMPPKDKGKSQKLPDNEIQVIREWVRAGGTWPKGRKLDPYEMTTDVRGGRDWWSLRSISKVSIPKISKDGRNPIDAFIEEKRSAAGLTAAPEADRRTLVRRLYFDLVGLPPSYEEIEAFINDSSPNAYENLVDRLLASPHHGERWARFWLDLIRYADTNGYERDAPKPNAWKYRDYVIRSINNDKPYDRFILEQLAGDELPDRTEETIIATGMLRVGTWDDEPNDKLEYKYDRLEDLVHATSTAFLGMTIKCARCHDHKFDPIPQTDYYRFASAFWPGDLIGNPSGKVLGHDVLAWTDLSAKPEPLKLLKKGDPRRPLKEIEPGFVSMISVLDRQPFTPPSKNETSSLRRLQLAKRIADPQNPLTARVYVNRIWQYHFGQGLVRTSDNFGFKGDLPSHPELLDWLTQSFMDNGWRTKPLHKMIVMSATYRQSSTHPNENLGRLKDSANRLLWHMNPRRLDAEGLRDALLQASGQFNLQMGGPGFTPQVCQEALEGLSKKGSAWEESPSEEQRRRAIYMFSRRSLIPPLMTTFDFCDTTRPCAQRDKTIVAPQALTLLNNEFSHSQSDSMAERISQKAKEDPRKQVRLAWNIAFGRDPRKAEIDLALKHLETQRTLFQQHKPEAMKEEKARITTEGLQLWLRADQGVKTDQEGSLLEWQDQSGQNHHARQEKVEWRPSLKRKSIWFDGNNRFLQIDGELLTSQDMALFAVVSDQSSNNSHREILSNWNRNSNVTTSVFLGLTGTNTVRFSDNFPNAGKIKEPNKLFLLSAFHDTYGATVSQNRIQIGRKDASFSKRNVKGSFVIGQQGNIDGEYWHGEIREIMVFNRALSEDERKGIEIDLMKRHALQQQTKMVRDPNHLALASLCHVLLNANEFIFID
jgi:hypothetical protein